MELHGMSQPFNFSKLKKKIQNLYLYFNSTNLWVHMTSIVKQENPALEFLNDNVKPKEAE